MSAASLPETSQMTVPTEEALPPSHPNMPLVHQMFALKCEIAAALSSGERPEAIVKRHGPFAEDHIKVITEGLFSPEWKAY